MVYALLEVVADGGLARCLRAAVVDPSGYGPGVFVGPDGEPSGYGPGVFVGPDGVSLPIGPLRPHWSPHPGSRATVDQLLFARPHAIHHSRPRYWRDSVRPALRAPLIERAWPKRSCATVAAAAGLSVLTLIAISGGFFTFPPGSTRSGWWMPGPDVLPGAAVVVGGMAYLALSTILILATPAAMAPWTVWRAHRGWHETDDGCGPWGWTFEISILGLPPQHPCFVTGDSLGVGVCHEIAAAIDTRLCTLRGRGRAAPWVARYRSTRAATGVSAALGSFPDVQDLQTVGAWRDKLAAVAAHNAADRDQIERVICPKVNWVQVSVPPAVPAGGALHRTNPKWEHRLGIDRTNTHITCRDGTAPVELIAVRSLPALVSYYTRAAPGWTWLRVALLALPLLIGVCRLISPRVAPELEVSARECFIWSDQTDRLICQPVPGQFQMQFQVKVVSGGYGRGLAVDAVTRRPTHIIPCGEQGGATRRVTVQPERDFCLTLDGASVGPVSVVFTAENAARRAIPPIVAVVQPQPRRVE